MLRALPGLNVNVTQWDPFILFTLLSKLDEETRITWRNFIGRRENATVAELLEFLETKAIESQPSMPVHIYNMLSGKKLIATKNQTTKIFHTEEASIYIIDVKPANVTQSVLSFFRKKGTIV